MIISIIGAGALGRLYGGMLALAGHDVHFLMRSEYSAIKKQSYFELQFNELNRSLTVQHPHIYVDASELPKSDLVIITTKTTSNSQLKSLLNTALQDNTKILIIQNGIGNEEYISGLFPKNTIISGISLAAVTRRENALAEVFKLAELRLALYNSEDKTILDDIISLFSWKIKPDFKIFENYKEMRWKKLLWNTPFCALSIIYNQPSDVLAKVQPYKAVIKAIMHEVQDIAKQEGVDISDELINKTIEISCDLYDYFPSTYWDYKNKQKIEKPYLIDNVLQIGIKNNIHAPCLELASHHLTYMLTHTL